MFLSQKSRASKKYKTQPSRSSRGVERRDHNGDGRLAAWPRDSFIAQAPRGRISAPFLATSFLTEKYLHKLSSNVFGKYKVNDDFLQLFYLFVINLLLHSLILLFTYL